MTEPPQTPPPDVELTPRADAQVEKARKRRDKKQIIDDVTELADGPGANVGRGRHAGLGAPMTRDVSDIVTEHHFLPRSALVMRLLEIRDDPIAHFLPTRTTATGTFFYAAPPGLAPELADMFMRPLETHAAPKRRGASPAEGPSKRRRVEGSVAGDDEVEQARRVGSVAPSIVPGSEVLGRGSVAPGMEFGFGETTGGVEDFQMEMPEFEMVEAGEMQGLRERSKSVLSALSRLTTPAPEGVPIEEGEESYADATCPIAMFDDRSVGSQSQSVESASSDDGKGYSRNTVKALAVIRKELQPTPGEERDEEKVMSFKKMSEKVRLGSCVHSVCNINCSFVKASRRAASSFFFELLVLGTRDCVKLSQSAPFENIEVTAKEKLWERQRHSSVAVSHSSAMRHASAAPSVASPLRQASVAPSVASAFGL